MTQYWYLGARMKKSSVSAAGKIHQHDVARWVPKVFKSAEEAAAAAPERMIQHPGTAYFVQGFERELIIDVEGYSKGFKNVKEGVL